MAGGETLHQPCQHRQQPAVLHVVVQQPACNADIVDTILVLPQDPINGDLWWTVVDAGGLPYKACRHVHNGTITRVDTILYRLPRRPNMFFALDQNVLSTSECMSDVWICP